MSASVKQYSSKDGATKAIEVVCFGYTPGSASDIANMTKLANDTYLKVFGRTASINNLALRIDSFSFVTMSASIALQHDEIVDVCNCNGYA